MDNLAEIKVSLYVKNFWIYLSENKLANRQIKFYNETHIKDELLGSIMVNTIVTTSTISPTDTPQDSY